MNSPVTASNLVQRILDRRNNVSIDWERQGAWRIVIIDKRRNLVVYSNNMVSKYEYHRVQMGLSLWDLTVTHVSRRREHYRVDTDRVALYIEPKTRKSFEDWVAEKKKLVSVQNQ